MTKKMLFLGTLCVGLLSQSLVSGADILFSQNCCQDVTPRDAAFTNFTAQGLSFQLPKTWSFRLMKRGTDDNVHFKFKPFQDINDDMAILITYHPTESFITEAEDFRDFLSPMEENLEIFAQEAELPYSSFEVIEELVTPVNDQKVIELTCSCQKSAESRKKKGKKKDKKNKKTSMRAKVYLFSSESGNYVVTLHAPKNKFDKEVGNTFDPLIESINF